MCLVMTYYYLVGPGLLDVLQGLPSADPLQRGKSGTPLEFHVLLLELLLAGRNVEGQGDLQEKKFFIDNTAKGLIPSGNISLP